MALSGVGVPQRGRRGSAEARGPAQSFVVSAKAAVEARQTSHGSPAFAEPRRASRDLAEVRGTSQKPAGPHRASLGFAEARLLSEKIRKGFFTLWSLVVAAVPSQRVRGRPCQ